MLPTKRSISMFFSSTLWQAREHYRVREHFLDKTGQGAVRLRNHACDRMMTHSKDKRLPCIFSCRGSPFVFVCFRLRMLSDHVRNLAVSWLREGRKVPEIFFLLGKSCSRSSLYNLAAEWKKGDPKKKKKQQKRPPSKVTPAMVRRMARMLTTGKSHHSFRSVARSLEIDESTVRYHMKKKGEKCFKKIRRNLISKAQQETRRKCCMNLRKTLRSSDVPSILFTDECYFIVGKHFNHQNERCYGKSLASIPDEKKFRESPKTSLSAMVFEGVSRDG